MTKKSAIFLTIAGLLLGGLVGLYLAIPSLIERALISGTERVETHLAREISWDSFHFERNHTIEIRGLTVKPKTDNLSFPPIFSADRIALRFDPMSLMTGRLRLKSLQVESPVLHLVRGEKGSNNYEDLLQIIQEMRKRKKNSKGSKSSPSKASFKELTRFLAPVLPEASLVSGKIILEDRREGSGFLGLKALHLEEANIQAKERSLVQESTDLAFTGTFKLREFGNTVKVKGFATYPKITYGLSISLDQALEHNLGARQVRVGGLGWSMDSDLELQDVRVGAIGDSQWDEDPTIQIGKVQVKLRDEPTAAPDGEAPSGLLHKLLRRLDSVTLVAPQVYVERYGNRTLNLDDVARSLMPKSVNPEDEQPPQKAVESLPEGRARFKKGDGGLFRDALRGVFEELETTLRKLTDRTYEIAKKLPIRAINVEGGTIRFVDELLFGKNFQEEFHNFSLQMTNGEESKVISFRLAFESQGTRNRAANTVSGKVHLDTRDVQVHLGIRNLDLAPYSALFPGLFPIEPETVMTQGDMDLIYNHEREIAQVEGLLQVEGVSLFHPSVATTPLTEMEVDAELSLEVDLGAGAIKLREGIFGVNGLVLELQGNILEFRESPKLDFEMKIPLIDTQKIADAFPREFVPKLHGLKVLGEFGWNLSGSLDSKNPETLRYKAIPTLSKYRLLSLGKEINFKRVRGHFTQSVREAEDKVFKFETGPGSENWVAYEDISPWMVKVVTTTEDGAFFRHKGISTYAMKDSIITNIEKGGFYRGASTISQQLVKNLFLAREKTLSRKFQELFITWEMEKVFEKEELLALYFNVIEFGPEIYGIKEASEHYFAKHPRQLSLLECIFLGSLIPNPKKYYFQFTNGKVTDNWRKRLAFFGKAMRDRKKIDETKYESMKPFSPRFVQLGEDGERIAPSDPKEQDEGNEELFIPAYELNEDELEREENMAFDKEVAP